MDSLPESFVKPAGSTSKRYPTNRPAPFSPDEFSTASIDQGSQAYVRHVEQDARQQSVDDAAEINIPKDEEERLSATNAPASPVRAERPTRPRRPVSTPKQSPYSKVGANDKANIRLEIDAAVRKDMIKIKHRVGITHGVEVSYAAYFMFLHERCRADSSAAGFLADLANFTEQRKQT
jgi:hypothetical protein